MLVHHRPSLDKPGVDAAFVLGGDQDIAMHVLANTHPPKLRRPLLTSLRGR